MFWRTLGLLQHVRKYALGFCVASDLVEQVAVADPCLDSRIVMRNRFVFAERFLWSSARLERARVQQMAFRRLIVRPPIPQLIQSGYGLLRMAQPEICARFSEHKDRILAERKTEDMVVVALRLLEFAKCQAFLSQSMAI